MIGKFGAAKDQWFSSFLLQVENHSSWHRLFVDPLSRAMYSSDGPVAYEAACAGVHR
ncbi:TPA: hypothetical protein ACHG82_004681 [Escherichia coli]|nr:hypothetical protein [Escherichia coli]